MSVAKLSSEVIRFISSENPEIVCIKGKWGVGKTYAWRKLLKESQQKKSIALKQYSYVSLFGRNSLTDLRNAVVENSISTDDLDAKPSLTSLEQAAHVFRQGLNRAGFLSQYLPKSDKYADGIQRIMFLLARNKIVCLDDLERAGTGLNIKDVLGLASQLKEEKGCKVIILLNDEKLEESQKIDFEDQLEKVADIIFNFDPSPEEAITIALTTEGTFKEMLAQNIKKFKVNNIRVIKKTEFFCNRLIEVLDGLNPRVLHQAIHTATLASFSKFQPGDAPTIEYIMKFDPYAGLWDSKETSKPQETDPHADLLLEYGFGSADEFDKSIISGIEKGFFDDQSVRNFGEAANHNLTLNDQGAAYREAWKIYHDSYEDNADEIIESLIQSVRSNISVVDISNLDAVIQTLRELEANEEATELIKYYVNNKNGDATTWDTEGYSYRGGIKDAEVLSACNEKFRLHEPEITPKEVLLKVGISQGWNTKDDALLAKASIDDIKQILKSVRGEPRSNVISAAKLYLSISNPSAVVKEIQRKLDAALREIASENDLNRRRIKGVFGIDIDGNAST
ncbi:MAG TPA: P-loop NTPase fold protein [Methylobacterium sp.]|uniref:P-loop NTPase fold protein n=1 Tax=Methylorubrum sp. B1-46 TaxID=2897334 RepID=UPI001E5A5B51|nr:P-loop NTPase fold protein [Methylorubrum sp. B1-46]UGB24807.1 hypothetical protein LPC10_17930 [Methylorubrum sp. B1-46]HEV2542213.1 P-loop NTPase fold protein [Methylobacterium sp.]